MTDIQQHYTEDYESPLGKILLAATKEGLMGLWFYEQKYFAAGLNETADQNAENSIRRNRKIPEKVRRIFQDTVRWLDAYFAGTFPLPDLPALSLEGTDFQIRVWKELLAISYGCTLTYGEIAKKIAAQEGKNHMSAQAVGSAVGHNKISILVPCHRVIGKDGALTGYAGGIHRKRWLLELEQKGRTHGEEL